ncbi:MAG: hypothetical protein ACJ0GU_01310 [Gammaproteobacteria bacterium]
MIKPLTLIWLGFYSRVLMALFGGGQLVGDSFYYHWIASRAVNLGERGLDPTIVQEEGHGLFSSLLSSLYFFTTDSYFIGCLFSIFVWLLSAYVLRKTLGLLNADKRTVFLVLIFYCFLPSSLINTSVPMRESFELLFVNLLIYSSLRIYLNRSFIHWIYLMLSGFLLGQFHRGLYAFSGVILFAVIVSSYLRNRKSFPIAGYLLGVPFVVFLSVYGFNLFSSQSYNLSEGLYFAIQTYQEGTLANMSRASYEPFLSGSEGTFSLLLFLPINLFQYLFEPMPWRISSIVDIVLTLENLFRGMLIYISIKGLMKTETLVRRPLLFLFLAYLVIEIFWSFGTTNWGTAARHHVPGMGLILITGFYFYAKYPVNRRKTKTL